MSTLDKAIRSCDASYQKYSKEFNHFQGREVAEKYAKDLISKGMKNVVVISDTNGFGKAVYIVKWDD